MVDEGVSEFFKKNAPAIRAAVKEAAVKELKGGGGVDLPAGIKNGVMKLLTIGFKTVEGRVSFRASSEVIAPTHGPDGSYLKGGTVWDFITVRPTDVKGDIDRIVERLRRVAGDGIFTGNDDLPVLCGAIESRTKADPIYFRFSTTMGKASGQIDPNTNEPYPPRVNVWWNGPIVGYVPPSVNGSPTIPTNGHAAHAPKSAPTTPDPKPWEERQSTPPKEGPKLHTPPSESEREPADRGTFSLTTAADDTDWTVTGGLADGGDVEAAKLITAAAKELGYTDDDLEFSDSWSLTASWVAAGVAKGATGRPVVSSGSPTVGDTVKFYPPTRDNPEVRSKKGTQCEVMSVEADGTMTIKSLIDSNRTWSGVRWDDAQNVQLGKK